ncbi:MAG: hypothetical protein Q8P76_04120 [bacterium]|nr:hypothetical protein [bacterium]
MGKLSDQELGKISRRLTEVLLRTDKGLLNPESVMIGLQFILNGQVKPGIYQDEDSGNMFTIRVNHDLSLKEMIKLGEYQKISLNLSELAVRALTQGYSGEEEVRIQLFHFGRTMTSAQVLEELQKSGCRPATMVELLAIGAQHPLRQKQYRIATIDTLVKVRVLDDLELSEAGDAEVSHTEATANIPGVCLFTSKTTGERILAEFSGFLQWAGDFRFPAVHL